MATILAVIAAVATAHGLDRFAYRYDRINFNSFYNWGHAYNRGDPVWASVRPRRKLQYTAEYFCDYTPFFVEMFSPLSRLDEKAAHTVWQLTQMAALVAALLLLARTAEPRLDWPEGVIFAAIGVTFRPPRYVSAAVIAFVTACVLSELSRKWSRVEPAILLPAILFVACAMVVGRHAESREPGVETIENLNRASQWR